MKRILVATALSLLALGACTGEDSEDVLRPGGSIGSSAAPTAGDATVRPSDEDTADAAPVAPRSIPTQLPSSPAGETVVDRMISAGPMASARSVTHEPGGVITARVACEGRSVRVIVDDDAGSGVSYLCDGTSSTVRTVVEQKATRTSWRVRARPGQRWALVLTWQSYDDAGIILQD